MNRRKLACKHAVFFALAHIVAGGAVVAGGGILFGLPNQLVAAAAQRMAAAHADVAAAVDNAKALFWLRLTLKLLLISP